MPVTIDITKDLRYQQGVEEKSIIVAEKFLKEGLAISFVQKVTDLPIDKTEEIVGKLSNK